MRRLERKGKIRAGALYVGPGSPWENQFEAETRRRLGKKYSSQRCHDYRRFAEYLEQLICYGVFDPTMLTGKDLVCSCKQDEPYCHADLLLAACETMEAVRKKKFTRRRSAGSELDRLLSDGPSDPVEGVIFEVIVWERASILRRLSRLSMLKSKALDEREFEEYLSLLESEDE